MIENSPFVTPPDKEISLRFHITKLMPEIRKKAIVEAEGQCPVCGSKKTGYRTIQRTEKTQQNTYVCYECSSEWVGNAYNLESTTPTYG